MRPIFPPLMCRKVSLTDAADTNVEQLIAAQLRSRRHKSPEHQGENVIAIAYELNQDERTAIAAGAPLIVGQVTYGNAPAEQLVHVGADTAAEYYGVKEATPEELAAHRDKMEAELDDRVQAWQKQRAHRAKLMERHLAGEDVSATMSAIEEGLRKETKRVAEALKALGEANQAAGF